MWGKFIVQFHFRRFRSAIICPYLPVRHPPDDQLVGVPSFLEIPVRLIIIPFFVTSVNALRFLFFYFIFLFYYSPSLAACINAVECLQNIVKDVGIVTGSLFLYSQFLLFRENCF